jgi:FKBP12-rapamycin complex-associated protein
LHSYLLATHYDSNWYKAWHTWALANFEVVSHLESQKESTAIDIPGSGLAAHIVQAVQGQFIHFKFRLPLTLK